LLIIDRNEYNAFKRALVRKKKNSMLDKLNELIDKVDNIGVDFVIIGNERIYVIERKTLTDMINSIHGQSSKAGGRFWKQLDRVKLVAEQLGNEYNVPAYPLVILEGSIFQRYKARYAKLRPAQWFGIQSEIAEKGVGLIRTWNRNETIIALERLKERSGKIKSKVLPMSIKKSLRNEKEEAMHMLYAVSGIGSKKAYWLIEKYGSVKNIVNLSEERLKAELGKKVGAHFYEVVNTDWRKDKKVVEDEK